MTYELNCRIVLESPPVDVDFGLQKGSGNNYETKQIQRYTGNNLEFYFPVTVKLTKDGLLNFLGPFMQGPVQQRFIYIDIGTYAGQKDSCWSRRLKVPLTGIELETIKKLATNEKFILEARVAGTGKDRGPNCATVKPFYGWHLQSK